MFEYKEIVKKNGRILVFCNFEDLLKEVYGVNTMDQVEAVMEKKGTEIIARCPFCKHEHTKSKLYIRDDMTTGWCFLCNRTYINVTDTLNTDVVVPRTFADFGAGPLKFELPVMKDSEWSLDKYYYEFDDESDVGMKYLLGRHGFFKDLAKALDFKFWNGNVVMPFKHDGKVYYYQIRFTGKNNKIRYFLPPVSQKSCYIIERSEEDVRHRILIVEGIYDCVAALIQCPDYTPVAVLGSSISDYQIAQIRDYAGYVSEVTIWMDETDIFLNPIHTFQGHQNQISKRRAALSSGGRYYLSTASTNKPEQSLRLKSLQYICHDGKELFIKPDIHKEEGYVSRIIEIP